ncbi:hypothetical protein ES332_D06G126800v1 [Gossypium tomentosum]|uniref:Uncharacterized protein n=1 Tax=Gossypium tomentosum TaxID=34277 RepID=A0A5D2KKA2_GOSTO|nr:hypothetical protein ES332_D06G126800v1 [Gossypium tomentosum]
MHTVAMHARGLDPINATLAILEIPRVFWCISPVLARFQFELGQVNWVGY